jgi:hypothetical protein
MKLNITIKLFSVEKGPSPKGQWYNDNSAAVVQALNNVEGINFAATHLYYLQIFTSNTAVTVPLQPNFQFNSVAVSLYWILHKITILR